MVMTTRDARSIGTRRTDHQKISAGFSEVLRFAPTARAEKELAAVRLREKRLARAIVDGDRCTVDQLVAQILGGIIR